MMKLPMTADGTPAASVSQVSRACRAQSETYTMPSTRGIVARSARRIPRNTIPSRLIEPLAVLHHSSA